MKNETRHFTLTDVEIRSAEGGEAARAKGYAAVFDSDSHDLGGFVERIQKGAFARSLSEADNGTWNIYALWAHDVAEPLASTRGGKLILTEDDHGLAFEMDVTRMTPAQLDALKDGDLQMSFGFSVRDQNWKEDEEGKIDRTLIDVDLHEISFVICPAYPETEAALRSLTEWRAANDQIDQPVIAAVAADDLDAHRAELIKRALLKRATLRAS